MKRTEFVYAGITKIYQNTIAGNYCFLGNWQGIMSFKMVNGMVRNDKLNPSVFAFFRKTRRLLLCSSE